MNGETVIQATGLGKAYPLYDRPFDLIKGMSRVGARRHHREFWAVKNIDLDVAPGEIVGIVGRNGSGKSTLLSMVAQTTKPTAGTLSVTGRVAPLLELGSGFHPDFTGRENVALNAAILGLTPAEIRERQDSIYAFADIGDYLDMPIKKYSSGMQARLAFAVAVHVEADVLIVDEALSVGDELFQQKCLTRLKEFSAGGGAILFVTHASQIVIDMCSRSILLHGGECLLDGKPETVVGFYQKLAAAPPARQDDVVREIRGLGGASTGTRDRSLPDPGDSSNSEIEFGFDPGLANAYPIAYAENGARISDVHVTDPYGNPVNVLRRNEVYHLHYRVDISRMAWDLRCSMLLKNATGGEIGGFVSNLAGEGIETVAEGQAFNVTFRFCARLNPGIYFVNAGVLAVVDGEERYMHRIINSVALRVPSRPALTTALVDLSPPDGMRSCTVRRAERGGGAEAG